MLSRISGIEGIDAEKGIEVAGGEDAYVVICRNFYDTADMRINMIREAFEKKEYHDYTIQVHALKSSARLIGALALSRQAEELEEAGREENFERIQKDTSRLLDQYEWYFERFGEVLG